jgi:creatinine amidohydrolase
MLLYNITMPQFIEGLKKTRTVIIPFGSVEEHGEHLPLGTDTMHVYDVCRFIAEEIPVFIAPPVNYGLCKSTSLHPGTLTIQGATLRLLTMDIVTSLYLHGLKNFILISGHAGKTHISMIIDAGEELLNKFPDIKIAALTILDLKLPDGLIETPGDSHAGELETSVIQYMHPELVKGTSPEEYPQFPKHILVRDKLRYWRGGVWGNPQKASRKKGKTVLEEEKKLLIDLVEKLEHI